jgi:hypothetical protein
MFDVDEQTTTTIHGQQLASIGDCEAAGFR